METDIRLRWLRLEHFKGTEELLLAFDPAGGTLLGENGSGKTTVFDAFSWLLYGKDSQGRERFGIRPLDREGKSRDRQAITAVEALLTVNDRELRLRRTYYENWVLRQGQRVFDGNQCGYFIDGVAVTRSGYDRQVGQILDEERFRLLTCGSYFPEQLNWLRRRALLFELANIGDRQELLKEPRWARLAREMGEQDPEIYRKKLLARRKELLSRLNELPARISENEEKLKTLEEGDPEAHEAERQALRDRLAALTAQLRAREDPVLASRLEAAQNRKKALELENRAHREELAHRRAQLDEQIKALRREQGEELRRQISLSRELEALRLRQEELLAAVFRPGSCPACGRPLVGAALETGRQNFEARREKELTRARQQADALRAELETLAGTLEDRAAREETLFRALEQAPEPADLPGYRQRLGELTATLEELEAAEKQQQADEAGYRAELEQRIAAEQQRLHGIEERIARLALARSCRERIADLRAQAERQRQEAEELDGLLEELTAFTRYRAGFVEERVNSLFAFTRFRLYRPLVSGAVEDCCDATFQGVPYEQLNTGARINVGLDIIGALSRCWGVSVPLFVDNAESVRELTPVDAQVIRLQVAAGPLRMTEKEESAWQIDG